MSLEECSGCGVSNWGWQDNGWGAGVLGPVVYFATTGTQRLRIQTREDGLAIDQIVLSPSTYLNAAPGLNKNDTTILPEQGGTTPPPPPPSDTQPPTVAITSPANGATVNGTVSVAANATDNVGVSRVEMLLDGALVATDTAAPYTFAWDTRRRRTARTRCARARSIRPATPRPSTTVTVTVNNTTGAERRSSCGPPTSDEGSAVGSWCRIPPPPAASRSTTRTPGPRSSRPLAAPAHYFEVTFNAQAGRPYRLWIRGKADGNYWANDSVFIQFDRLRDLRRARSGASAPRAPPSTTWRNAAAAVSRTGAGRTTGGARA